LYTTKFDVIFDEKGNSISNKYCIWDSIAKNWLLQSKRFNYYSDHIVVKITAPFDQNSILMYPNPISNKLYIELKNEKINNCKIFNNVGLLVKVLSINDGLNIVDFSNFNAGLYFIMVSSNSDIIIKEIIKK
jgi:hypothetical protein